MKTHLTRLSRAACLLFSHSFCLPVGLNMAAEVLIWALAQAHNSLLRLLLMTAYSKQTRVSKDFQGLPGPVAAMTKVHLLQGHGSNLCLGSQDPTRRVVWPKIEISQLSVFYTYVLSPSWSLDHTSLLIPSSSSRRSCVVSEARVALKVRTFYLDYVLFTPVLWFISSLPGLARPTRLPILNQPLPHCQLITFCVFCLLWVYCLFPFLERSSKGNRIFVCFIYWCISICLNIVRHMRCSVNI